MKKQNPEQLNLPGKLTLFMFNIFFTVSYFSFSTFHYFGCNPPKYCGVRAESVVIDVMIIVLVGWVVSLYRPKSQYDIWLITLLSVLPVILASVSGSF